MASMIPIYRNGNAGYNRRAGRIDLGCPSRKAEGMRREEYDVAQICRNGHVVNPHFHDAPADNAKRCRHCGSETINCCTECKEPIRGALSRTFAMDWRAPRFCENCGDPYPWTKTALDAARESVDEDTVLTEADKSELKTALDDIVRDSPRTTLAASRYKRLAAKAGKSFAEGLKAILIQVASETAKKVLWS